MCIRDSAHRHPPDLRRRHPERVCGDTGSFGAPRHRRSGGRHRGQRGRCRVRAARAPGAGVVRATLLRVPDVPALSRGTRTAATAGRPSGFGAAFWLFWVALICGAGIEFATTFWASDLLADRTGASASLSAGAVSALVIGMAVSRFVVGPMSLHKAPEKLLLAGYATAGVGWLVFWLATSPLVAVAGLVVAGLGYGTHFPLAVSLVLRASAGRPDRAQARATLGAGAAIGVAVSYTHLTLPTI